MTVTSGRLTSGTARCYHRLRADAGCNCSHVPIALKSNYSWISTAITPTSSRCDHLYPTATTSFTTSQRY